MKSKFLLRMGVSALAVVAAAAFSSAASAKTLHPLGPLHRASEPGAKYVNPKKPHPWTNLKHGFPGPTGPSNIQLMTDGSVMVHSWCSVTWWKLTPDNKANYANGTWSQAGSLPSGYLPFFFASQVLPDGQMIMNGGEYNGSSEGNCGGGAWTNKGALYDPVKDKWTAVSPPTGWANIGDAQSVILDDGTYMLADAVTTLEAIATIKGTKVTWKATGTGKADRNDEEGWTLMPNGTILTVDATRGIQGAFSFTEVYDPKHGSWSTGANTFSELTDPGSSEVGPGVLQADGTVIWFGGTPQNNLYDPGTNTWSDAGGFPLSGYDVADGPAVSLPSGNVLVEASPGVFNPPAHFFEWNGSKFTQVSDPDDAPNDTSFEGRFLLLPTGQVLYSNDGQSPTLPLISVYTPQGNANADQLPKISKVSATLKAGSKNNAISGKNFNGFTQGAYYGDDAQEATNWPIVMITNNASKDVCFGRSHDFSTSGVAITKKMNAQFDLPNTCESGASTLTVAVNGVSSKGKSVTID